MQYNEDLNLTQTIRVLIYSTLFQRTISITICIWNQIRIQECIFNGFVLKSETGTVNRQVLLLKILQKKICFTQKAFVHTLEKLVCRMGNMHSWILKSNMRSAKSLRKILFYINYIFVSILQNRIRRSNFAANRPILFNAFRKFSSAVHSSKLHSPKLY